MFISTILVIFARYLISINQYIMTMNTDLKKTVGQRLQLLRIERNLTQEQMGEKLNLSTSAYCKIEYGETDLTLTRLSKIAEVMNLSPIDLFCKIYRNTDFAPPRESNLVGAPQESSASSADPSNDLRELIRANSRMIDVLIRRIDLLERRGV